MAAAARHSAGILLWRRIDGDVEVLIGHMGGPFWSRREAGAWSIPKGEYDPHDEAAFETALREFGEELGHRAPSSDVGDYVDLGVFTQSNKTVQVFAIEGDLDPETCVSNTFEMEWPRGSGTMATFAEVDRVEWCALDVAAQRLVKGQVAALGVLVQRIA